MIKIMQRCLQLLYVEGKLLLAEQNIRESKTRTSKLNAKKLSISPTKIILNSAANMSKVYMFKVKNMA